LQSQKFLINIPPLEIYWSLQKDLFPKFAKEGKLIGYPISGNWVNVHSKEDVEKVKSLLGWESQLNRKLILYFLSSFF
jgi:NDP-sugar pyrophosphorylase family protein